VALMAKTGADILSIEPQTNASHAREKCGGDTILMGGVDTADTLLMKDAETVKKACERSIADGIQILAPGCAVSPGTPTKNLLAMVEVARRH
jgi:[methyl-Co(III) methanol-specific corrinoid protein]:coenzyme M methyltransferase